MHMILFSHWQKYDINNRLDKKKNVSTKITGQNSLLFKCSRALKMRSLLTTERKSPCNHRKKRRDNERKGDALITLPCATTHESYCDMIVTWLIHNLVYFLLCCLAYSKYEGAINMHILIENVKKTTTHKRKQRNFDGELEFLVVVMHDADSHFEFESECSADRWFGWSVGRSDGR